MPRKPGKESIICCHGCGRDTPNVSHCSRCLGRGRMQIENSAGRRQWSVERGAFPASNTGRAGKKFR